MNTAPVLLEALLVLLALLLMQAMFQFPYWLVGVTFGLSLLFVTIYDHRNLKP